MPDATTRQRFRDPHRPDKIVDAAARLIARDGYAAVTIADIGADAGIVGSGVYRHFDSKAGVLMAIFERVIDELLAGQQRAIDSGAGPVPTLRSVIDGQIDFVVGDRAIAQVYYSEIKNLPDNDRRRLRRKQRRYLEGWVELVRQLDPHASDARIRTLVHAAIGSIHSSLNHDAGIAESELRQVLAAAAWRVLTGDVDPPMLPLHSDVTI